MVLNDYSDGCFSDVAHHLPPSKSRSNLLDQGPYDPYQSHSHLISKMVKARPSPKPPAHFRESLTL